MNKDELMDIDKSIYDVRIAEIRRGVYGLGIFIQKKLRDKAEAELLEDFKNNTITPEAKDELIRYQVLQMEIGKRKMEDVPKELRELVMKKIEED